MNNYLEDTVSLISLKKLSKISVSNINMDVIGKLGVPELKNFNEESMDFLNYISNKYMSNEMILFWDSFHEIGDRFILEWAEYINLKDVDKIMYILKDIQEVLVRAGSLYLIMHAILNGEKIDMALKADIINGKPIVNDIKDGIADKYIGSVKVIKILDTLFNFNPEDSTNSAKDIIAAFGLNDLNYNLEQTISPSHILRDEKISIGHLWKLIGDIMIPESKIVSYFKN